MGEPDNISTREYIEAIVLRLEASLKEQVGELRLDIKHMQANYVTRNEFDAATDFLRDEAKRIEADGNRRLTEYREASEKHLAEFKDDLDKSQNRAIALVSVCLTVLTILVSVALNFI